jgi:hypothetical protein
MCSSVDGQSVWQPSSAVGRLYMAYLGAVERELDLSAGTSVAPGDPDDIQLDSEAFVAFVCRLGQLYTRSDRQRSTLYWHERRLGKRDYLAFIDKPFPRGESFRDFARRAITDNADISGPFTYR